jgi:hypothetical protein
MRREDRNAQREDLRIKEDDARDTLITATTKLDDNFTSIKQLPQDALSSASPEVVASLTKLAKTNRYKKNDETLRPLAMNIELTDPQRFLSKDFVPELMRKGASPALIRMVQTQQENVAKKQMNAKPDVVSDGTLWRVARPAFTAAGIIVSNKTPSGKQKAAAQQQQAVTYLRTEATEWANAHPGEKPTDEIMSQWVGAAMLKTKSGAYSFQANDQDIYNSIPDAVRNVIIRDIRRRDPGSRGSELISDVANVYRKMRANYGTGPITLTDRGIRERSLSGTPVGGFNEALANSPDAPDALDEPVVEDDQ